VDDPRDWDGKKDEAYAAATVIKWDRTNGTVVSRSVSQSLEYGDLGDVNMWPSRIQAGTFSGKGGLWGGNGTDWVPGTYPPQGHSIPAGTLDRFPLLVWDGLLYDGVDAVLLVPTLWESDGQPRAFDQYKTNWLQSDLSAVLASPTVQAQLKDTYLYPNIYPADHVANTFGTLVTIFTAGVFGHYSITSTLMTANLDRPIGLLGGQNTTQYQDRMLVLTREKLSALTPGTSQLILIPFAEPVDGALNGLYTLYVRVERIQ
jgi:hypothetical protein